MTGELPQDLRPEDFSRKLTREDITTGIPFVTFIGERLALRGKFSSEPEPDPYWNVTLHLIDQDADTPDRRHFLADLGVTPDGNLELAADVHTFYDDQAEPA